MVRRAREQRRAEFEGAIRAAVVQPVRYGSPYIDPVAVEQYLQACHELVLRTLRAEAAARSTTEWLFRWRQVPEGLFGWAADEEVESFFEQSLAETITGLAGLLRSTIPPAGPAYPTSPDDFRKMVWFAAGVSYLRGIDWLLRSAGRGTRLSFERGEQLPFEHPTPEQQAGTERYINRIYGQGSRLFSRAGVRLAEVIDNPTSEPFTMLAVTPQRTRTVTVTWETPNGQRVERIPARYRVTGIRLLDLVGFSAVVDASGNWPPKEFFALALLLRVLHELLQYRWAMNATHRLGCLSVETGYFAEILAPLLPTAIEELAGLVPSADIPRTAEGLLATLDALGSGSVRPLRPARVLHVDGALTLVDLTAATALLDFSLAIPANTGALGTARGVYFERRVQSAIDNTPWSPPAELRVLRGRTFKRKGLPLTDIDALGCANGTLLFVSAKSRIFSSPFDAGGYRQVRNAADGVVAACEDAARFAEDLRAHPKGDNFDLSQFDRIAVVVCTAYAIYVPIGRATSEVLPGLTAAVSLLELHEYLSGNESAPAESRIGWRTVPFRTTT